MAGILPRVVTAEGNSRTNAAVFCKQLLKIHFSDRKIRDYRSAYMTTEETTRQTKFNLALLNRGVLAASYGLMALSTPMTDSDIEEILRAVSDALEEVVKLS